MKRLLQKGFDPFMENAKESFVAEIEDKKAEIAEIERAELAAKEQPWLPFYPVTCCFTCIYVPWKELL